MEEKSITVEEYKKKQLQAKARIEISRILQKEKEKRVDIMPAQPNIYSLTMHKTYEKDNVLGEPTFKIERVFAIRCLTYFEDGEWITEVRPINGEHSQYNPEHDAVLYVGSREECNHLRKLNDVGRIDDEIEKLKII